MRRALQLTALAAIAISATFATAAFNAGDVGERAITVNVVADDAAYVGLGANPGTPHSCFVDVANGRVSVTFDATSASCAYNGGGTGIQGGDGSDSTIYGRYAFHDLLRVKNQGVKGVNLWINATTTSASGSALTLAAKTSPGLMTESDYGTTSGPHALSPGDPLYLGLRVLSGTLTSGGQVTGSVTVEARAT